VVPHPILPSGIGHVCFLIALEQVIRSHARRVVAAMQDPQFVEWPDQQAPRNAMGEMHPELAIE